jgi:hypothetical protein
MSYIKTFLVLTTFILAATSVVLAVKICGHTGNKQRAEVLQ